VGIAAVVLWAAGVLLRTAFARGMFLAFALAAVAECAGLAGPFVRCALATGIGFPARLASAGIAFVLRHNSDVRFDAGWDPLRDNPQIELVKVQGGRNVVA
jgi:hypothetical protein